MNDDRHYALICRFEDGKITDAEHLELFQHLVDTGDAWTLQGFYGREAVRLLNAGLVQPARSTPGRAVN